MTPDEFNTAPSSTSPDAGDHDGDGALGRTQRRHLRRIFNGRTVPILIDDHSLLTYKQAKQLMQSLSPDARDAVYERIKAYDK